MADLLSRLSAADRWVLDRLCSEGDAWVVGGWVRDSLSGLNPGEMDIATTLRPAQIAELFARTVPVGAAFGTVLVLPDDGVWQADSAAQVEPSWEVTTLRSDGTYGDGRRPDEVEFGDDIVEDLSRRDFTINAMAMDPRTGEVIDPFGGSDDLDASVVRAVGDANERIGEDGLRIMRAFRFLDAGEAGERRLDSDLESAIRERLSMLEKISSERKWAELARVMQGRMRAEVLARMADAELLSTVLGETSLQLDGPFSGVPGVDLAILCREDTRSGADLSAHLKSLLRLSNDETRTISFLHDLKNDDLVAENTVLRRYNAALSDQMKDEAVAYFGSAGVAYAEAAASVPPPRAGNRPIVGGEALMQATGLEAGPRLGRLKGWLHRRQIEDDLATTEDVLSLLESIEWQDGEPESWQALAWP
ncbi:MAG: CCA tRNA nucleotidyltransferase [Candidatus Thalassarchaeaceae archaeon]|nr:CCA tRNA nucleotidyltransferase [Candidatus Thalassarchaeaceae archaeon]